MFASSNAGVIVSNPTEGINAFVCSYSVCGAMYVGRDLAMGDPPSEESYRKYT
jgi:hypothetical protein